MKNEKLFSQLFAAVADEQMGLAKIVDNLRKKMKSKEFSALAEVYYDAMGDSRTAERKAFLDKVICNLPYYVENGTSEKIACDWVAYDADKDTDKRQIREYRFGKGNELQEVVSLDVCATYVCVTAKVEVTEVVTFASGFQKELPALDKDGNKIVKEEVCEFVPRRKAQWGYTPLVKNAIMAALTSIAE